MATRSAKKTKANAPRRIDQRVAAWTGEKVKAMDAPRAVMGYFAVKLFLLAVNAVSPAVVNTYSSLSDLLTRGSPSSSVIPP